MTKKIANAIIFVSLISLLLSAILSFYYINNFFYKEQNNRLISDLEIISKVVEKSGQEELYNLPLQTYQITLLDTDGTILYDNIDSKTIGKKEDVEKYKQGHNFEYSNNIIEQKTYSVKKLSDGKYLRIVDKQLSSFGVVIGFIQPIFIFVLIIIIFSIVISNNLSRNIIAPLKNIDLKNPLKNVVYEELKPLLNHLNKQNIELKKNVEQLYIKNFEMLHITENIEESILVLDSDGIVLQANEKAKQLLNIKENFYYLTSLENDDTTLIKNVIDESLKGENSSGKFYKDNKVYKITAKTSKLQNGSNAVFVIFDDITEEEENLRFRKEFSANVSHELKTPLSSIMAMSEMISEGIVKEEDTKIFANKINKESVRLLNLIQDIIKLSKLDEGYLNKHFEKINLKSFILEIVESLHLKLNAKNINIQLKLEDLEILGIRQLIYDALKNVIDNAINYNKNNGNIEISLVEQNNKIVFVVNDSGIGIAKEHQNRIFERFYRVDNSHSKLTGGTGLGLAIVKNVVAIHNAKIDLCSELNLGTTIKIIFNKE